MLDSHRLSIGFLVDDDNDEDDDDDDDSGGDGGGDGHGDADDEQEDKDEGENDDALWWLECAHRDGGYEFLAIAIMRVLTAMR